MMVLTIVFPCGRAPMRITIQVERESTIKHVKHEVSRLLRDLAAVNAAASTEAAMSASEPFDPVIFVASVQAQSHIVDTVYRDAHKVAFIRDKEQVVVFLCNDRAVSISSSGSFDPHDFHRHPHELLSCHEYDATAVEKDEDEKKATVAMKIEHGKKDFNYLAVGDAVGVPNDRGTAPSHARITASNENGTYDICFWTGKHDFGYILCTESS
jgi:hypothetical protein